MKNLKSTILWKYFILFFMIYFIPNLISGQGPERPIEMPTMHIEGELKAKEKAESSGKGEYGNNGSSKQGGRDGGRISNGAKTPTARKSTVEINGQKFLVSADAEKRISTFLNSYKGHSQVGQIVAAIASFFSLADIFSNLDKDFPLLDASYRSATFNADEVILKLSTVSAYNRALRAQAVEIVEGEMGTAILKGQTNEAKMWALLRDILANPERYQNGGIKWDPKGKSLINRAPVASAYRSIAGFDSQLSAADIQQLGRLTNILMYYASSRDFIVNADYIYDLKKDPTTFPKITLRDRMILNKALLTMPDDMKIYLSNAMQFNASQSAMNYNFWSKLKSFLYSDGWNTYIAVDSNLDSLGFPQDEEIYASDLVTGEYPQLPLIPQSGTAIWRNPYSSASQYQIY